MTLSPAAKHTVFFFSFIGVSLNILYAGYSFGIPSIVIFLFLYSIVAVTYMPKKLISPSSIIFGYYFIWFILAPTFSELHAHDNFASRNYYICYFMITLVFATAIFGIKIGEQRPLSNEPPITAPKLRIPKLSWLIALYCVSSTCVVAIVLSSGGFEKWIADPGDAFLNRTGSGIYVVASHFSTFCLSGLVGYYAFASKRKFPIYIFLAWLLVTSPVHGSKGLISLFLILLFSPWLASLRMLSIRSVFFILALVGVFFLGLYFRNISWLTISEAVPYALNYFTTLRNLHILVEDFDPNFMTTFWLPFNKFLTPFGLKDSSLYFDMNHYLTDIYFPTAWKIRATEQWPVEADMYLNFYFIFGLPLIFLYTFIVSRIHSLAFSKRNLGLLIVSMLLIVSLVSHFRGSIINHLDFYLYPMFVIIYFLLRGYGFPTRQ